MIVFSTGGENTDSDAQREVNPALLQSEGVLWL